jgi:hypothetical protein
MVYGFGIYAFINFAIFVLLAHDKNPHSIDAATTFRGFSGHWMFFYSAALGIMYSATRISDVPRKCINGHVISPAARFCEQCGSPVNTTDQFPAN